MPEEGVRIPAVTALLRFVTKGWVTGGFVTMGELRGERRHADGDVLGAVRPGRVPDPLPRAGHDRLAGADLDRAARVLDHDGAGEHEGDLVELGRLPGLGPPGGGGHPGHAERGAGGGHPPDVLVDDLAARDGDARRFGDDLWHGGHRTPGTAAGATGGAACTTAGAVVAAGTCGDSVARARRGAEGAR